MLSRPIDAPGEIQRAIELLVKNWQLALPTAIAALISTCLIFFFVAGTLAAITGTAVLGAGAGDAAKVAGAAALSSLLVTMAVIGPIIALASWLAHAAVIAASRGVWHGAPVDLGAAFSAALAKLGPLIVAGILLTLIFLVSLILPVIGFLAVAFFSIYTVPAIMLGNATGGSAIGESFRLAKDNAGPTFLLFFAIIIAYVVGTIVNSVLGHIPIVNFIAAFFVGGLVAAFAALASARFYEVLTGTATASAPSV
jgi:hypothetical protein